MPTVIEQSVMMTQGKARPRRITTRVLLIGEDKTRRRCRIWLKIAAKNCLKWMTPGRRLLSRLVGFFLVGLILDIHDFEGTALMYFK
jgi:hypothetical protein